MVKRMRRKKLTIKQMADKQFSTISIKHRKRLGINKTNFRTEFRKELRIIRKKRR